MAVRKDLHEDNRLSWNAATDAHNSHKGDQARFFREGGNKLYPEERELLGEIAGLSVLHLQCNSGQDTLSMAQLGAAVTGVDISDTAIEFARALSAESGVPGVFYRSDIYDWLEKAAGGPQRFDIVFCSYGAICWLSDLQTWAKRFAAVLKPGGRFVTVDFHPMSMIFEMDWSHKYPYFAGGQAQTWDDGVGDYVADARDGLTPGGYLEGVANFQNPHRVHEFQWTISEIVSALLSAGLTIDALREYAYANGAKLFDNMRELPGRRFMQPETLPSVPLMYAIAAHKAGH